MSDPPTAESESTFVCDCSSWMRLACAKQPFYAERDGRRYCVLHFQSSEKTEEFRQAIERKISDQNCDFSGVWFPANTDLSSRQFVSAKFDQAVFDLNANFSSAEFHQGASFRDVTFNGAAEFRKAKFYEDSFFSDTTFNGDATFTEVKFQADAHFVSVTFRRKPYFIGTLFGKNANFINTAYEEDAIFSYSEFRGWSNFDSARFKGKGIFQLVTFENGAFLRSAEFLAEADFSKAVFRGEADFEGASFRAKADFSHSTFASYFRFSGSPVNQVFSDSSALSLEFTRIEKPDRLSFHSLTLRPHWFLNVDASKFDFINVHWRGGSRASAEIKLLEDNDVSSPHRLLAIACRKLAGNAEGNDRYREASHFRRMAMDAERLATWRGFKVLGLNWWYWLASGYGERPFQAFLVLLGVMMLSAVLYNHVGFVRWETKLTNEGEAVSAKRDDVGAPLKFSRALTYSAGVMTLQKPEPRPATPVAQTVVLLETILGPVQAALLALAIRRKFMR